MAKQVGKVSNTPVDNYKGTSNHYCVEFYFNDGEPAGVEGFHGNFGSAKLMSLSDEEYEKNHQNVHDESPSGNINLGTYYYNDIRDACTYLAYCKAYRSYDVEIDDSVSKADKQYLSTVRNIVDEKFGVQPFIGNLGLYDKNGNHGGTRQTFVYDASEFKVTTVQRKSGDTTPYQTLKYIGSEMDGSKIYIPAGCHCCDFMFENVKLKSIPKILKSVNSTEGMFDGVDASLADQVKDALENRLDKTDACYLDIYESKPVKQVKEMRDAEMKARKKVCEAKPKSESVEAAFGNIGNSSNDTSKELGG